MFEREQLLKHPLVRELIAYKWKKIGISSFLLNAGCYFIFLVFLTAFSLVLPHPINQSNNIHLITAYTYIVIHTYIMYICIISLSFHA